MSFLLPHFTPPDFSLPRFSQAPDAVLVPSPKDKVAPEQDHATTIFPEYFKIGGQWLLAKKPHGLRRSLRKRRVRSVIER